MTAKDNFIEICDLTTDVMGLQKGSLAFKSRVHTLQIPRMVASVIGRKEEEIHHNIIADVLQRDRTSIYHYERTHQNNYTWEEYRNVFNKVYKAYKKTQDEQEVFITKSHMKKYLLANGVSENKKQEAIIQVKSGKVVVEIKTSYFEFSNQMKNIKLALKNYKYEIEII